MSMDTAIVHIRDISKNFGGLAALQQVSIAVERGSITAVIGPNGAGKSTLINVLSGFLLPDSGSILLNNTLLTGKKGHAITRLGMARTFQTAQVFGHDERAGKRDGGLPRPHPRRSYRGGPAPARRSG